MSCSVYSGEMDNKELGSLDTWSQLNRYYLGKKFGNTFKETYLDFLLREINRIHKHFKLRQLIYNLSPILFLCIKPFRNATSLKLITYFQKWQKK